MLLCPIIEFDRSKKELSEFRLFEKEGTLISQLSEEASLSIDQFVVVQILSVWDRYERKIFPALSYQTGILSNGYVTRISLLMWIRSKPLLKNWYLSF
jgi:hypothetical protein